MPTPQSTINQPRGNGNCYAYAPMCAYHVTTGNLPNVTATLATVKYRMGGNSDSAFKLLCGYGISRTEAYKTSWGNVVRAAAANGHPIAFGVQWQKGTKKGNHWVYYAETADGKVMARDQQNGHLLITIDPSTWAGSAAGGWTYTVTMVGVGCADRNAARQYV